MWSGRMCILILRRVISRSIFGKRNFDYFYCYYCCFCCWVWSNGKEIQGKESAFNEGIPLYTGVRLWMYISNRPDTLLRTDKVTFTS